MKYQARICDIGAEALDFLIEDSCNFLIIFNETAPPELAEIAVLQEKAELKAKPIKGDIVEICGNKYTITDVGYEAINTLKELGHCTLSFNGLDKVQRPGMIELQGEKLKPETIKINEYIKIYSK
ncbi:MAG: PTS glucitol/sorbitol transporter subunit IIA [Mycoplasmatales bacterium]